MERARPTERACTVRPPSNRRRTRGIGPWPSGIGVTIVSCLVVFSAWTAGAPVPTKLAPPFTGVSVSAGTGWGAVGCQKTVVSALAKWNPKTGVMSFGGSSAATTSCPRLGSVGGWGASSVDAGVYLSFPLALPNGTHSVEQNWTISLTAGEHAAAAKPCPAPALTTGFSQSFCALNALFDFGIFTDLYDSTNNTYFSPGNFSQIYNWTYVYNYTYCYLGTCSNTNSSTGGPATGVAVTAPFTYRINGVFARSHAYVLAMMISMHVDAEAVGFPASSAFATLSLHHGSSHTQLNSILIR